MRSATTQRISYNSKVALPTVNKAHLPRLEPAKETGQRQCAGLVRCTNWGMRPSQLAASR